MTTATTIPERCTVTATVEGKEEVENGILLRLTIPQFKSKYPVPVRVTPEVAAILKVGHSLAVALVREKLKADKTGRYYTDYYWGWTEKQPDSRQVVTSVTPEPESRPAGRDATGISIERQKALDLAGRDYWEYCRVKGWAPKSLSHAASEISGLACAYAKWTIGQGKPVPLIERMPDGVPADPAVTLGLADDAPDAPASTQDAQVTTEAQAPTFASFADQLRHYNLTLNDVAACLPEGVVWDKATREQRKAAFAKAVEVKHAPF